ncbi:hypothetical protein FRB98_007773 [Tulasnella sp. 332]|nr:hypothetical protein FRB98_007773 [Tulasnella sp. 332]
MGTATILTPAAATVGAVTLVAETAAAAGAVAGAAGAGATGWAAASTLGAGILASHRLAIGLIGAAVAGPGGWVLATYGFAVGMIIVAGDADMEKPCCWERVLNSKELSDREAEFHKEHGILLPDLAKHCEIFRDKADDKVIFRNKKGEHFAFSVSLVVPADKAVKDKTDIRSANLQDDIATKDRELEDVKINLKEAIYKLQMEADKAIKLQDALEKKTTELQRERLNRQNVENAFDSAQAKQKATQRNLEQVQLELDNYALHNSGASEQQSKLLKERDALQSRVKELEVTRSRAVNLESEVTDLRAENERLQREATDMPLKHHFTTPGRSPIKRAGARPRSSSVSGDLRATRLEAEVEEMRSAARQLEEAKDVADAKLRKAMKDLLAMENGKMAAESIAEKEIARLKDELDDRRLDLQDLRHQLQYTDLDHADDINNEIGKLREEVGPLRTEVEQLKKRVAEQDAAILTDSYARETLVAESQSLRLRITVLESELSAAPTQSQRVPEPEPASELPRTGSDRNLRLAQRELSSARRENSALQAELKQLDDLLAEREEELANLRMGSSCQPDGHDGLAETKIAQLEAELRKATEERGEALNSASTVVLANEQLGAVQSENATLRSRIKGLENQLLVMANETAELRRTASNMADCEKRYAHALAKTAELEEQLQRTAKELKVREAEMNTLTLSGAADFQLLQADLEQKEQDLDRSLEQLEAARQEARTAKQDLQILKNERQPPYVLEVIQKALADANDQLEAKEAEVVELREAFTGAQADIAAMEVAKRQAEDELEEAMAEAKSLTEVEASADSSMSNQPPSTIDENQHGDSPNASDAEQMEHLLNAIGRLRAERDELRERLHFLQLEIRFNANPTQAEKAREVSRIQAENEKLNSAMKIIENGLTSVVKAASPSRKARLEQLQVDHADGPLLIEFIEALVSEVELQLSVKESENMAAGSTSEVPKSHQLRYEVEDLKLRVLRRQEQIGVHQHDIKRLEMNLKMAEDGLEEVTTELRACQSENSNLVEDSCMAREERDQVNKRLEEAEDEKDVLAERLALHVSEIGKLRGQVQTLQDSSAQGVTTLVEVTMKGAAQIRSLKAKLEDVGAELENSRLGTQMAQQATASVQTELAYYDSELQQVSQEKAELATLYSELQQDHDVLREDLVHAKAEVQDLTNLTEDNRRLRSTVQELHTSIEEQKANIARETGDDSEELENLRVVNANLQNDYEELSQQHAELTSRMNDIAQDLDEARDKEGSSEDDKSRLQEDLDRMSKHQRSLTKELESVRARIEESAAARVQFEQFYEEQHAVWVRREKELVDSTVLQAATLRGEKEANEVLVRSIETVAQRVREENGELAEKLAKLQSALDENNGVGAEELHAAQADLEQFKAKMESQLAGLEEENRQLRSKLRVSEATAGDLQVLSEKLKEMEVELERKGELLDESDDKLLEVLKERKKLQAKVDNLTRQRDHYRSLAPPTTESPPVLSAAGPPSTNLAALVLPPISSTASTEKDTIPTEPVVEPSPASAVVRSPARQRIFSPTSMETVTAASSSAAGPSSGLRPAPATSTNQVGQARGLLNIQPVHAATKSRPLGVRRLPPGGVLRGAVTRTDTGAEGRSVLGPLSIQPSSAASVLRGRAPTPESNPNPELTSSGSNSNLKKRLREEDDMPDARRLPPMPVMAESKGDRDAGTPTVVHMRKTPGRSAARGASGGFAPSRAAATTSSKDMEDSQNRPPAEGGGGGQSFVARALLNLRPKSPSKPRRLNLER